MKSLWRAVMLTPMHVNFCRATLLAAITLVAGCSLPPLTRSVVVQRNPVGSTASAAATQPSVSQHASGTVSAHTYHVVRGDTLYSIAFRAGVDFRQLAAWNGIVAPYVIHPGQNLRLNAPMSGSTLTPGAPVATSEVPETPVFQPVPTTPSAPPTAVAAQPTRAAQPPSPAPPSAPSATVVTQVPSSALSTVVPVAGKPVTATPSPSVVKVTPGKMRHAGGVDWRWPADGPLLSHFNAGDAIPGVNIGGKTGDPVRAAADGVVVYSGNGLVGYGELVIIKHNDSYLSAYGHNRKRLVKEGERVRSGQVIAEMGSSGASRNELEFQVRRNGTPVDPLSYLPTR